MDEKIKDEKIKEFVLRHNGIYTQQKLSDDHTENFSDRLKKLYPQKYTKADTADETQSSQLFITHDTEGGFFILKERTPALEQDKEKLKRERAIIKKFHCEMLVKEDAYLGDNRQLLTITPAYLDSDKNPNTLDTLLIKKTHFSLDEAMVFINAIVEGIDYLHNRFEIQQIIHRDIKPENIFIENNKALIGDFDYATISTRSSGYYRGTINYWAPEIGTSGDTKFFPSSDIYSLATIIYDILSPEKHLLGYSKFWKDYESDKINVIKRKQKSIDEVFEKRRKEFPYKHILDVLRVAMRTNPEKRYADVNVFFKDFLLAKALEEMKDDDLKKGLGDLEEKIRKQKEKEQKEKEHKVTINEKMFEGDDVYEGETDPKKFFESIKINFTVESGELHFLSPDIMSERYELFQRLSEFLKRPLNDFDLDGAKLDESLGALAGVNNRVRLDLFWMMAYLLQAIPISESSKFAEMDADSKSRYLKEKLGGNFATFENMHKEMSKIWKAYQGKSGEKK